MWSIVNLVVSVVLMFARTGVCRLFSHCIPAGLEKVFSRGQHFRCWDEVLYVGVALCGHSVTVFVYKYCFYGALCSHWFGTDKIALGDKISILFFFCTT